MKDTYCSICIKKEDWTEGEFAHYEQDVNNLLEKHPHDTFIKSEVDDIQAKKIEDMTSDIKELSISYEGASSKNMEVDGFVFNDDVFEHENCDEDVSARK